MQLLTVNELYMLAELLNFPLGVANISVTLPATLDFTMISGTFSDWFDFTRLPLAWTFVSPGEEILQVGWFRLKWYGVLIASAVLIGVNLSMRLARSRQVDPEAIADLAIWLVLAADRKSVV